MCRARRHDISSSLNKTNIPSLNNRFPKLAKLNTCTCTLYNVSKHHINQILMEKNIEKHPSHFHGHTTQILCSFMSTVSLADGNEFTALYQGRHCSVLAAFAAASLCTQLAGKNIVFQIPMGIHHVQCGPGFNERAMLLLPGSP